MRQGVGIQRLALAAATVSSCSLFWAGCSDEPAEDVSIDAAPQGAATVAPGTSSGSNEGVEPVPMVGSLADIPLECPPGVELDVSGSGTRGGDIPGGPATPEAGLAEALHLPFLDLFPAAESFERRAEVAGATGPNAVVFVARVPESGDFLVLVEQSGDSWVVAATKRCGSRTGS